MKNNKEVAAFILKEADIKINGNNPWDITVHNPKFYQRVLSSGSMGLGESYMDGWWDCEQLDEFFYKIITAKINTKIRSSSLLINVVMAHLFNRQSKIRSRQVGKKHYDIGNDFYQCMLDKHMAYSCGYWRDARNLDEAQADKLDLICRKLSLNAGEKILDIGCGWGGLIKYAVEKYKVKAVGITISKKQAEFAKKLCQGLPIEIRLQDYRDINEKFDSIVSVGMFEHVGYKNYRELFKVVNKSLKNHGLCLIHTIASNQTARTCDPWFDKYIFPNGMLPSIKQIGIATEGLFVMEDWHNFGSDYDKTLMAWYKKFNNNWDKFKDEYGDRFYRMWRYYLLSLAGGFRARYMQLWQITLSKDGVLGGYKSIR